MVKIAESPLEGILILVLAQVFIIRVVAVIIKPKWAIIPLAIHKHLIFFKCVVIAVGAGDGVEIKIFVIEFRFHTFYTQFCVRFGKNCWNLVGGDSVRDVDESLPDKPVMNKR